MLAKTRQEFGLTKWEQYTLLIRDAIKSIKSDPAAFPAKRLPALRSDIYYLNLSRRGMRASHLLFFKIRFDGYVVIGRLLHERMDPTLHLPPAFLALDPS